MIGSEEDPGIMVLTMKHLFAECERKGGEERLAFRVVCSFLEIYNENIRWLKRERELVSFYNTLLLD